MPEKKTGVFDMIMGVFRSKKELCVDIVGEADNVIENYINCRRDHIVKKYKKKSRFMSFLMVCTLFAVLYMVYRIAV